MNDLGHEGIPCGGGTGFFKDKEGSWRGSYFGNDEIRMGKSMEEQIQISN